MNTKMIWEQNPPLEPGDRVQWVVWKLRPGVPEFRFPAQAPHAALLVIMMMMILIKTRQSKHCAFSIYIFDNSKSKSMVRLVRAEKMVLSGLVFARKIARMILIQNIQGLMGPLMINMAFMPLYMWEMWDVMPVTDGHMDARSVESRAVFCLSWLRNKVERNPLL